MLHGESFWFVSCIVYAGSIACDCVDAVAVHIIINLVISSNIILNRKLLSSFLVLHSKVTVLPRRSEPLVTKDVVLNYFLHDNEAVEPFILFMLRNIKKPIHSNHSHAWAEIHFCTGEKFLSVTNRVYSSVSGNSHQ